MATREEIKTKAVASSPEIAILELLDQPQVAACTDESAYTSFKASVYAEFPDSQSAFIVGSGNWGFSMHPDKNFKLFNDTSDIDVGIIDPPFFSRIWEALRSYHRNFYYQIPSWQQTRLKRNGENIYSGFVSPKWIPELRNPIRIQHAVICNRLSNEFVKYKPVNLLIFKNIEDMIDYYRRGLEFLIRSTR
jgi:hypothetical protein